MQKLGGNPQPGEALDPRPEPDFRCDSCGWGSDYENDFAFCEHPGCENDRLCDSCINECDGCGRFFCGAHIDLKAWREGFDLCAASLAKRSRAA